jgi:hypothetical protein
LNEIPIPPSYPPAMQLAAWLYLCVSGGVYLLVFGTIGGEDV